MYPVQYSERFGQEFPELNRAYLAWAAAHLLEMGEGVLTLTPTQGGQLEYSAGVGYPGDLELSSIVPPDAVTMKNVLNHFDWFRQAFDGCEVTILGDLAMVRSGRVLDDGKDVTVVLQNEAADAPFTSNEREVLGALLLMPHEMRKNAREGGIVLAKDAELSGRRTLLPTGGSEITAVFMPDPAVEGGLAEIDVSGYLGDLLMSRHSQSKPVAFLKNLP